jgi:hypothetical protein
VLLIYALGDDQNPIKEKEYFIKMSKFFVKLEKLENKLDI